MLISLLRESLEYRPVAGHYLVEQLLAGPELRAGLTLPADRCSVEVMPPVQEVEIARWR